MGKLTLAQRVKSFRAYVQSMKQSWFQMADVDGAWRCWRDMSPEGKLEALVYAAAYDDVPFGSLAETIRQTLGDLPPGVVEEASLRVSLRFRKELRAVAKALPEWWSEDHEAPPLPQQVRELVDSYRKDAAKWAKAKGRDLDMDRG